MRHGTAEQGLAEGGEGSHATPSDADEPRGRETIRSKEDSAHTVDKLSCFSNHNCRTWNPGLVSVVCTQYCDKSGMKSSWLGMTVECIGGIGGLAGWVGWKYEAGSGISVGTAHLLVGLHTHTQHRRDLCCGRNFLIPPQDPASLLLRLNYQEERC